MRDEAFQETLASIYFFDKADWEAAYMRVEVIRYDIPWMDFDQRVIFYRHVADHLDALRISLDTHPKILKEWETLLAGANPAFLSDPPSSSGRTTAFGAVD